jgi:hypothetical protein
MIEVVTDEIDRMRRIGFVISEAERHLGLDVQSDIQLDERLDRVLSGALAGGLDPLSYAVCWALRHAAGGERTKSRRKE